MSDDLFILWFNNLPIEERVKILGIDISCDADSIYDIDIVAIEVEEQSIVISPYSPDILEFDPTKVI